MLRDHSHRRPLDDACMGTTSDSPSVVYRSLSGRWLACDFKTVYLL